MTREEAILCIKGIKNLGHDMFTEQKDFQECLDMAIKALEQETVPREHYEHEYFLRKELDFKVARLEKQIADQEPCEDCWSKKEVVDIINRQRFGINKISMGIIKEKLEALPPVAPIHKVGKWIAERDDYGNITGWHCSNCYNKTGFVTTCAWDYCPSCGSRNEMEEERKIEMESDR